jgi:hypothetical protein
MQNYIVYEVHETLLFQSASVAVSDKAVLEAVDRLVDQEIKDRINREFEGRQSRMEDHLRAQGQTLGQVRAEIRREVLITHHLQETILPRIANPTRQELWDFYQEHLDDFTTQESRELWLIDIPYAGDPAAARAAADQAASRLAAGEPFEEVARTLSKGIHAQRGGAWGEITTQMQGRYAQVSQTLFGLPEGAASDVIDTGDAYFIVKAGRVQPAQRRPFTEVQPELAERYRAARFASLRQQLLEKLLSQAVIEPDEGPFLQALVEAAPSHAEMLAQPSSPP